jgi:hypothetical protein
MKFDSRFADAFGQGDLVVNKPAFRRWRCSRRG